MDFAVSDLHNLLSCQGFRNGHIYPFGHICSIMHDKRNVREEKISLDLRSTGFKGLTCDVFLCACFVC